MSSTDRYAKELELINALSGYGSNTKAALDQMESYLCSVDSFRFEAVRLAVVQFQTGQVAGHDRAFPPTAPMVAAEARRFDDALEAQERIAARRNEPAIEAPSGYKLTPDGQHVVVPIGQPMPAGHSSDGLLDADFGDGRINMRDLSPKQKEWAVANKRLPPAKPDKRIGVTPRLQRA